MLQHRGAIARWAVVVLGSLGLGWVFTRWGVPASWILAAIICSAAMALGTGKELKLPRFPYTLARGLIGMLAALPMSVVAGSELLRFLLPGLFVSILTVVVGIVGGVLLHRAQPKAISWETGILSMLPGGASMMPMLAAELGADYRYVSLTQYLRLLAVSFSLPLVTALMVLPVHEADTGSSFGSPSTEWWVIALVVVIAVAGGTIGKFARIPAPFIFGPMLLTVLIGLAMPDGVTLAPVEPLQIFAFLAIGWICGGSLSVDSLKAFASQLPATIGFIVALMAVCALSAWPLVWWLDITYFEAYLATTPGALETVLALASEGGATAAVVAVQLIRIIFVLGIASYLPQLLNLARGWKRKHGR